jgi:hypothetical protein
MTDRQPNFRALDAACETYAARFGEHPPTWGYMGNPRLPAEILAAVARGERLTAAMLDERLGLRPTPPGALE